ncbi:MAG: N-acyl homoserine lactonase family protein [Chitinophagales bacterium]
MYTKKIFTSKGKNIEVYAIETGKVAMKTRAFSARRKNLFMMLIDILSDKKFTPDLPIYAWVIKHPEGIFLVDAGEIADVTRPDYFKKAGWFRKWFSSTQVHLKVRPEEEINIQLKKLGISNEQIKSLILTHTHNDHIDGIRYFKGVKVLVNVEEWKNADLPMYYPEWLQPDLIQLNDRFDKVFDQAYKLTKNADLFLIPTPGHTRGHCSVLLKTDKHTIIFAGDVVYDQEQLRNNTFTSVNPTLAGAKKTYAKLRSYMKDNPTIFLPSHDQKSFSRLMSEEIFSE